MRLKLVIAYDGAPFVGWQSQEGGRTVQDLLEASFKKITRARVVVYGSGRTDSGVHALGQVAHADVPDGSLKPSEWRRALNACLPPAIRVLRASRAKPDFHARFDAKGKVYRYVIRTVPVLPPHEAGRVWHLPQELDLARLEEAAGIFVGRHDFAGFSANRRTALRDTWRSISRLDIRSSGTLVSLTFEGEGFLYKMVRMLTGAIIRVAQGRAEIAGLRERLAGGGTKWNYVAPAAGLYLVKVKY